MGTWDNLKGFFSSREPLHARFDDPFIVHRRPKRDPVNFRQVTDPKRFSSASYRIISTAWDPTRDGLSSISPVAYRHDHGGPALDAYSQH